MAVWRGIEPFPGYSVSDEGNVRNDATDRLLRRPINEHGIVYVGISRDNRQYKRSVASLVTQAFLPRPKLDAFNTPIHLNGDKTDVRLDNLDLRPLWFARAYHQQFHQPRRGFLRPVVEIKTGEVFKNSWEAAIKFGLLDREILIAMLNGMYVYPTLQVFKPLGE